MTIPPLVGITPPNPHEAAPRGVTGILCSLAKTSTLIISSTFLGWTTKSGSVLKSVLVMIAGRSPMSWLYWSLSAALSMILISPAIVLKSSTFIIH